MPDFISKLPYRAPWIALQTACGVLPTKLRQFTRKKKFAAPICIIQFYPYLCTRKRMWNGTTKRVLPRRSRLSQKGAIAQLVEQRTENPCVPSSILGGTTERQINFDKAPENDWLQGIFVLGRVQFRAISSMFSIESSGAFAGSGKVQRIRFYFIDLHYIVSPCVRFGFIVLTVSGGLFDPSEGVSLIY